MKEACRRKDGEVWAGLSPPSGTSGGWDCSPHLSAQGPLPGGPHVHTRGVPVSLGNSLACSLASGRKLG